MKIKRNISGISIPLSKVTVLHDLGIDKIDYFSSYYNETDRFFCITI